MKIHFKCLIGKKMPKNCFNKITGIWFNDIQKVRNHMFGIKGIFGFAITIIFDEQKS